MTDTRILDTSMALDWPGEAVPHLFALTQPCRAEDRRDHARANAACLTDDAILSAWRHDPVAKRDFPEVIKWLTT